MTVKKKKSVQDALFKCPQCGEEQKLSDLFSEEMQKVGETANCDNCSVELEISGLDPLTLVYNDDDGEDGDNDDYGDEDDDDVLDLEDDEDDDDEDED